VCGFSEAASTTYATTVNVVWLCRRGEADQITAVLGLLFGCDVGFPWLLGRFTYLAVLAYLTYCTYLP
jgi:hypothetical protein